MTAVDGIDTGTAAVTGERAVGLPVPTLRRSPWFLVALHLPFVVAGPALVLPRHDLPPLGAALTVLVAGVIGGLQLRHSFAMARGAQPAGAMATFLVLAVLVYVPLWWFTWDWALMQWFVVASGAMVLRRWPAVVAVVVAGPIVGQLVERARGVSGTATAGPLDGGRFRLRVEIPGEAS